MKRYYARGGLGMGAQSMPSPASYYTYGAMPPEIWPVMNEPPMAQADQDAETDLLGESDEGYAEGGMAWEGPLSALSQGGASDVEGPVAGPGTGRSDDIDARLSDGEYVFDAETVALLGDGSTAAGAELLDQMRERIRMHKGQELAKGKFSPAAKAPLDYLLGED